MNPDVYKNKKKEKMHTGFYYCSMLEAISPPQSSNITLSTENQMPQAAWKSIEYYFFLSLHFLWSEVLVSGSPSASACWWHQFQGCRSPRDRVTLTLPHGCYFLKWTLWKFPCGLWRSCFFISPLVWSSQVGRGSSSWDWRCVFTWWELRGVRIDSANWSSLQSVTLCSHKHRPWNAHTHVMHDIFYA